VTPSWDPAAVRAQKQKGNALLNPTYDETHDTEPPRPAGELLEMI
jgi:hypothetical protein